MVTQQMLASLCVHENLKYLLAPLCVCCVTFDGFKHSLGTVAPNLGLLMFSILGTSKDLFTKLWSIMSLALGIHLLSLSIHSNRKH